MTVSTTQNRKEYACNGVTTDFEFPYYFLEDEDLVVLRVTVADGTETLLSLGTDYTVSGAGDSEGGTVTTTSTYSSDYELVIYRDPAVTQGMDLVENDPLPAGELEKAYDRLTMIDQRDREILGRSLRLPEGDTGFDDEDQYLPPKAQRARKYLGFDADGKPVANVPSELEGLGSAASHDVGTDADHQDPAEAAKLARLDRLESAGASISPDAERPSFFSTFDDYAPIGPPLDPAVWNGGYGAVLATDGSGSRVSGMHRSWSDRARPSQILPYMGGYMALYSSGAGTSSITTSLAFSPDGYTWYDSPYNPILDQLDQTWQGDRSYGISMVWDEDNSRWALFVIGNDVSGATDGLRASGVFFSTDGFASWTASSANPIFTINSPGAQESFGAGTVDRVYVRSVLKKDGLWHALITVHGDDLVGDRKMVGIILTATDLEGPWSSGAHNPVFTDAMWDGWDKTIGVHSIIRYRGTYYMGINRSARGDDNDPDHRTAFGIARSDDLLTWEVPHTGVLSSGVTRMDSLVLFPLRTHWGILFGERDAPKKMYLTTSHINANVVQAITNQSTVP